MVHELKGVGENLQDHLMFQANLQNSWNKIS